MLDVICGDQCGDRARCALKGWKQLPKFPVLTQFHIGRRRCGECGDGGRGGGRGTRDGHGNTVAREGGGGGRAIGRGSSGYTVTATGHTDTATVCITTAFFCDVRMFLRATSAMMDVPTDEQELPEPVKLRALCEVSDEWEKLGRIRHQRTT